MGSSIERESLFRSWVEEHRGIVIKVASSFAQSSSDLADLQQEVLLQLWLSLPAYSGHAKPSTWIYRVALNSALAWRRKTSRHERGRDTAVDLAQFATPTAGPADHTGDRDLIEKLYTAIRTLPDFDRALVLLMLDGLSYREIAEITGLSETHVGVALTRARKRLATQMKGVADELE